MQLFISIFYKWKYISSPFLCQAYLRASSFDTLRIQFIVHKRMFHYLIIHKLFTSSHQHADMMDWNNFMLFTILIAFYFIVYLLSSTHFMSRHSVIISFVPYYIFFLCFHCKPSIDSGANSFKAYLSNYIRTNLSFTSCFF